MRLLLDTHIVLWALTASPRLKSETVSFIKAADEVYVSAASIWEVAIKVRLGKLAADLPALVAAVSASGFSQLPITAAHAAGVAQLPLLHNDPFDRLLISQALAEPLRLVTADSLLAPYSDLVVLV